VFDVSININVTQINQRSKTEKLYDEPEFFVYSINILKHWPQNTTV